MIRSALLLLLFLAAGPVAPAAPPDGQWNPTKWNGEKAFVSTSLGWMAVVSLERGRLMYFGAADRDLNLLLAPGSRANPNLLGGHRLWLGPQATWPQGWPPPAAWEYSEPESFTSADGLLRMLMPDAGDGWPRLTRTYRWDGAKLVCGAELAGGTRPAQIVHIFQMPVATVVSARAQPEDDFPAGYVQLPSTAGPFAARFPAPPHVSRQDNSLSLRHADAVVKLGFRPQPLAGHASEGSLLVRRGPPAGPVAGEPDEGFFTQVYLSGENERFIELEQLSPLFSPGAGASFAVILEAARP